MGRVTGLAGIEANLRGVVTRMHADAPEVARRQAMGMISTSKQLCPVLTGALRASIDILDEKWEGETFVVTWGTLLFYAAFVEFGTVNMDPQPFIRPAIHSGEVEYLRNAKLALFESLHSASRSVASSVKAAA